MSTVQYRPLIVTLPLLTVSQTIITTCYCFNVMSTKLLSLEPVLDLQEQEQDENNEVMKSMEQEIECPMCSDIMILSSDFDRLLYFCQECHLSLIMN